jgi:hypothetical protein
MLCEPRKLREQLMAALGQRIELQVPATSRQLELIE